MEHEFSRLGNVFVSGKMQLFPVKYFALKIAKASRENQFPCKGERTVE